MSSRDLDAEVERAARLLCRASGDDPDSLYMTDEGTLHNWRSEPSWKMYRVHAARLVVTAQLIAEQLSAPGLASVLVGLQATAAALETVTKQ